MFNNKPKAVILSLDEFAKLSSNNILGVLSVVLDESELKAIEEYKKTGHLDELVDAIKFLEELMGENKSTR